MGRRENLCLAQPMSPARQGLRGYHHKRRCLGPHRPYPPPHQADRNGFEEINSLCDELLDVALRLESSFAANCCAVMPSTPGRAAWTVASRELRQAWYSFLVDRI